MPAAAHRRKKRTRREPIPDHSAAEHAGWSADASAEMAKAGRCGLAYTQLERTDVWLAKAAEDTKKADLVRDAERKARRHASDAGQFVQQVCARSRGV